MRMDFGNDGYEKVVIFERNPCHLVGVFYFT